MTMTMTMNASANAFPASYWDRDVQLYLELPKLFEDDGWKSIKIETYPGPDDTQKELEDLLKKQHDHKQQKRRREEILREATGTIPQFHRVMLFSPGSHPNTYMLLRAMTLVGSIVVMHYKNKFKRPRPSQLEPELRPIIEIPGHPAYPSGHSTQAHLVAKALSTVAGNPEIGQELFKIAGRIGKNREWAGVHYASDTDAGEQLARLVFVHVERAFSDTFARAAAEWRSAARE